MGGVEFQGMVVNFLFVVFLYVIFENGVFVGQWVGNDVCFVFVVMVYYVSCDSWGMGEKDLVMGRKVFRICNVWQFMGFVVGVVEDKVGGGISKCGMYGRELFFNKGDVVNVLKIVVEVDNVFWGVDGEGGEGDVELCIFGQFVEGQKMELGCVLEVVMF